MEQLLTAGAWAPRLGHPKAQAAPIPVGREVRGVHSDVGELLVYHTLEEVRVWRLVPPRVYSARVELSRSLPVGREVTQERRLQQRAAATMFAPPPGHVVRAADLNAKNAGLT